MKTLDLSENYISPSVAKRLKAAFKGVDVSEQGSETDPDRYVQVSE